MSALLLRTYGVRVVLGCGLVAVYAAAVAAQTLQLKRPPLSAVNVSCPTFPPPPTPVQAQVGEANRLATLAQEAVLEGDHRQARDLFTQAAALDPRDASLAYRLGREHEALGQSAEAVREYCRYLALSPNAADAAQVSERIGQLLPKDMLTHGGQVVDDFRAGIADFDAHDWSGASTAFGKVVTAQPTMASAVYNRGLAYDREGDHTAAIRDYSRYAELDPQASDAGAVRARADALRREIPSTAKAFVLGLLPGGGQFYTGQPVLGVAVIAVAAGGVALALQKQTVTRDTTYVGPFGGTYPGTYTQTEHPHMALGIGVAAGVTLAGAIEAALVAHSRGSGLGATDTTVASRSAFLPHAGPVTVQLPTVIRAPDGLRWAFPVTVQMR
jgi:tetratricopeptide (TPR) repeat protein